MPKNLIDPNLVSLNPIEGFYQQFLKTKDQVFLDVINKHFVFLDDDLKKIAVHQNKIKELNGLILESYQVNQIKAKKIQNVFIIIACFLIIGLFFLGIYKQNKLDIKKHEAYQNEQEQLIQNEQNQINVLMLKNISSIKTQTLINDVFSAYSLKSDPYINTNQFFKTLDIENAIDIYSTNLTIYKNTPIYDIILRNQKWKKVITSGQRSVSYQVYDDSSKSYQTRWKVVVAYHNENTPYIEENNYLVTLSNYLKNDFSFASIDYSWYFNNYLSNQKRKAISLENDDFNKKIKFLYLANEVNLRTFFDFKTQEDFVNWNDLVLYKNIDFYYQNGVFVVKKLTSLPFLKVEESIYTSLNISQTNLYQYTLQDLKNQCLNLFNTYFLDWFKTAQFPLLVSGINREWYIDKGTYLIGNDLENTFSNNKTYSVEYLLNQHLDDFSFLNNEPKLSKWLSILNQPETLENNQIIKSVYALNSFRSEHLIDNVTVYDPDVGAVIIPVPYERFYPIHENKWVFKFNVNIHDENNVFLSLTDEKTFKDPSWFNEQTQKYFLNTNLYASDYQTINQSIAYQSLLEKLSIIQNQYPDFIKYANLHLSKYYGGLITVNNPQAFNEYISETELSKLISVLTH